MKISVLDHGFIELTDKMQEDPLLKIVNAARVSYAKTSVTLTEKDEKLIEFLVKEGHTSPFRHSYFTFRIKAPVMVFRQWWRYQVGSQWSEIQIHDTSWNEQSGRYVSFEPEFYLPKILRNQTGKQTSDGEHENSAEALEIMKKSYQTTFDAYQTMVKAGIAKEQARNMLPAAVYSECIWTASTQTLMHFIEERIKPSAQWEIQQYAHALLELLPFLKKLVKTPSQDDENV